MTDQSGSGPTSSGPNEPPKPARGDVVELIIAVLAGAAFTYLLLQPAPADRPMWQTIGLFVMLAVAISRIIAFFGRRFGK
jgi:hypothetical protein